MWTFIKFECKKYLFNKKVAALFLILFSFFIYQIVTLRATNNSGYSGYSVFNSGFVDNVRSDWWSSKDMDHDVREHVTMKYKQYIDEFLPDKETLIQKLEEAKGIKTRILENGEIIKIDNTELELDVEKLWEDRYAFEKRGTIFFRILGVETSDDDYSGNLDKQYFYTIMKDNIVKECIERNNHAEYLNKKGDRDSSYSDSELAQITSLAMNNLEGKPLIKGYHLGPDFLTSNMQFMPLVLGLFIVTSLYGMFSYEKVRKTDAITLTCKLGKKQAVFAKLITVFLFVSISWLVFQLVNLLLCQMIFTLEGMDVSVFDTNFPSPYGYTYATYYMHQLVVSYFGTLILAYALCFLSQLSRPVPTLCVSMIFVLFTSWVQYSQNILGESYSLLTKLHLLLPTQMMSAFTTFREYITFHIFGIDIVFPIVLYAVVLLGLPMLIIGIYFTARHRQIKN